jgi:hypothetical protein
MALTSFEISCIDLFSLSQEKKEHPPSFLPAGFEKTHAGYSLR